jgi:hypothetical protein
MCTHWLYLALILPVGGSANGSLFVVVFIFTINASLEKPLGT